MLFIDGFINSPLWTGSLRNFYTALLPLLIVPLAKAQGRDDAKEATIWSDDEAR
jgi:hypothetical protein